LLLNSTKLDREPELGDTDEEFGIVGLEEVVSQFPGE
jgi:hypothetical protein